VGEGSRARPPLAWAVPSGGVVAAARWRGRAESTGEALLAPAGNRRRKVGLPSGETREAAEGERESEGPVVVRKWGNAHGAKEPCCTCSEEEGRQGRMTKPSISLQDLKRRIYAKAKSDTSRCSYERPGFGWTRWSTRWPRLSLKALPDR
jgi:hypothetical protein